jgi:hypothetical protein
VVPNKNIDHTFNKVIRQREEHKELAGQFRFQPRSSVHRVLESLQNRDQLYLHNNEIINTYSLDKSVIKSGAPRNSLN